MKVLALAGSACARPCRACASATNASIGFWVHAVSLTAGGPLRVGGWNDQWSPAHATADEANTTDTASNPMRDIALTIDDPFAVNLAESEASVPQQAGT